MSPTSYDYETTIIWIQEFIDFPRSKETISASLFFITQIQNNAGIWGTIQMEVVPPPPPPPACSKFKEHSTEIEEVQSHWKGFCISMWLKCVTLSGRKGLNPFKHQLSSREPSCSLFCSPKIFVLNHCKDFPRLTVHLLVVHHIPWQQVYLALGKEVTSSQRHLFSSEEFWQFLFWKLFHHGSCLLPFLSTFFKLL